MSAFFLLILLALSLPLGQALQYGTADNDTIVLSKLTLEDLFGTRNLDKRMFTKIKNKLNKAKKPEPLHERMSEELLREETEGALHYWYIEALIDKQHTVRFEIDTYGVCTSIPTHMYRVPQTKPQTESHSIGCPSRPFTNFVPIYGAVRRSTITTGPVTSEGPLIVEGYDRRRGVFGWTLSNPEYKHLHILPHLLSKFKSPIFAIYLSDQTQHSSRVDIGGADETTFEIEYHKIVKVESNQHQPWLIGSLRIFVGHQTVVVPSIETESNIKTVFDSTTPYIYGPPTEVKKIQESIGHGESRDDAEVRFQWNGRGKWPIRPPYARKLWEPGYWEWYTDLFRPGSEDMDHWVIGMNFGYGKYLAYKLGPEPEMGIGRRRDQVNQPPLFEHEVDRPAPPRNRPGADSPPPPYDDVNRAG